MIRSDLPAVEPEEIRHTRIRVGLTQAEAARSVGVAMRTWQDWEAGKAAMPAGLWRLFRHLTGIECARFRSVPGKSE